MITPEAIIASRKGKAVRYSAHGHKLLGNGCITLYVGGTALQVFEKGQKYPWWKGARACANTYQGYCKVVRKGYCSGCGQPWIMIKPCGPPQLGEGM